MSLIFFLSTSALVCMMKSNKYRLSRAQTRTLKYVSQYLQMEADK